MSSYKKDIDENKENGQSADSKKDDLAVFLCNVSYTELVRVTSELKKDIEKCKDELKHENKVESNLYQEMKLELTNTADAYESYFKTEIQSPKQTTDTFKYSLTTDSQKTVSDTNSDDEFEEITLTCPVSQSISLAKWSSNKIKILFKATLPVPYRHCLFSRSYSLIYRRDGG